MLHLPDLAAGVSNALVDDGFCITAYDSLCEASYASDRVTLFTSTYNCIPPSLHGVCRHTFYRHAAQLSSCAQDVVWGMVPGARCMTVWEKRRQMRDTKQEQLELDKPMPQRAGLMPP